MSDSLLKQDAQTTNVLVWRQDKPEIKKATDEESEPWEDGVPIQVVDDALWDLAGEELAYPLQIEEQGRTFQVYFLLTNFESYEAERVRIDSTAALKIEGSEFETGRENPVAIIQFIDDHFKEMLGVSSDISKQLDFLRERSYLKTRLWREVITSPQMVYEDESIPQDIDLISLADSPERWYVLQPSLYCPTRKVEATFNLRHCLRQSSQVDFNEFELSVGGRYHTRLKEFKTTIDYSRLRKLYANLVTSVDGYLFNGQACTTENKKFWLRKMPLDHILTVIDEAFSQVRSKNG